MRGSPVVDDAGNACGAGCLHFLDAWRIASSGRPFLVVLWMDKSRRRANEPDWTGENPPKMRFPDFAHQRHKDPLTPNPHPHPHPQRSSCHSVMS